MAAVIQRPLRGSRISTFYPVKNLPSLASLDSAFQLQEYISLLIRLDVHDVDAIISLPGSSSKGGHVTNEKEKEEHVENVKDAEKKNEVTVDEACWIYEQLRRLAQDLSHPLITTLQQECTRASCPEMKAGEWLYLCVAHGNDGAMEQCCAIDYILHTVDSATALLNSPRTFPSRLQIPQTSHRHFSSLARRLGRIFAHAYFHHREAFEQAEAESSLYARFLALTAKFDLVPAEFLVIPSAQFMGEDSGSVHERDLSMRGYIDTRQHYPPQLRDEDHNRLATHPVGQKQIQQQQLGVGRVRSPNPSSPAESSSNGGIGENPTTVSRSRFGRSRTDTMVFAEAEANAFTDELAAKVRSSEAEDEHEGPKTAKPSIETAQEPEETDVEPASEGEAHFEISLSPDEEIPVSFEENKSNLPIPPEAKEEDVEKDVPAAPSTVSEPVPGPSQLEISAVEAEAAVKSDDFVPIPVTPEEDEKPTAEKSTHEAVSSEDVKAPEPAAQDPTPAPEPIPAAISEPEVQPGAKLESQDIPVVDSPPKVKEPETATELPASEHPVPATSIPTEESQVSEVSIPSTAANTSLLQGEPPTTASELAGAQESPEESSFSDKTNAASIGTVGDASDVVIEDKPTFVDPLATVVESSAIKPSEPETHTPQEFVIVDDTPAPSADVEAHTAASKD